MGVCAETGREDSINCGRATNQIQGKGPENAGGSVCGVAGRNKEQILLHRQRASAEPSARPRSGSGKSMLHTDGRRPRSMSSRSEEVEGSGFGWYTRRGIPSLTVGEEGPVRAGQTGVGRRGGTGGNGHRRADPDLQEQRVPGRFHQIQNDRPHSARGKTPFDPSPLLLGAGDHKLLLGITVWIPQRTVNSGRNICANARDKLLPGGEDFSAGGEDPGRRISTAQPRIHKLGQTRSTRNSLRISSSHSRKHV